MIDTDLYRDDDPFDYLMNIRLENGSYRLLDDYEAVVEACCRAWNALSHEVGRIQSLSAYPYIEEISS